jgi:hypothetical protein
MKAVIKTAPGEVELNWMWLPTFVGMNAQLKKELEERLAPKLMSLPIDEGLEQAHEMVIDFLVERFPNLKGLRDYLDALKYVEDGPDKG